MRHPGLDPALFLPDARLAEVPLFRPTAPRRFSGGHPLEVVLVSSVPFPPEMNALVLTVENLAATPVCAGLRLLHAGQPEPVSFSGGREILEPGGPVDLWFPRESFGTYGRTDSWRGIRQINLVVRREKSTRQPIRLDIAVSALKAVRLRHPPGPRLTALGLEKVAAGPLPGEPEPRAFGYYHRDNPALGIPPPVFCYRPDSPAELLAGRFMGRQIGFPPDWTADPYGELEWRHFLHRHHFLRALLRATVKTSRQSYLKAAERAITDWIRQHPTPLGSDGGAGPAWETLSVAFRLREWFWVAGTAWNPPGLSPKTKCLVLRSIWEHALHLMKYRGHPGNWRLLEAASLLLAGWLFPEFRDAGQWVQAGRDRLETEVEAQFMPDGWHAEISPLYQGLCAQACLEVRETARWLGHPCPPVIEAGLPRWFSALAALYRPDFTRPSLNDSGGILDHERALLAHAGARLDLPEAQWAGTCGRRGRSLAPRNRLFPSSGLVVLRSGYEADDLFVLFRARRSRASHAHADDLSLEFMARGRLLLVDPGISRYAPSSRADAYRRAESHSTLLIREPARGSSPRVNATPGRPPGKDVQLFSKPGVDVAVGVRRGDGLTITRAVALVHGQFLLVRDSVQGQGRADLRVIWQRAPDFLNDPGFRLILLPDWPEHPPVGPGGDPISGTGWVALRGRDIPAPRLEYLLRAKLPARFFWVLLPGDPGRDWRFYRTGRDTLEFLSPGGPRLRLDASRWAISVMPPGHTSV